ncbi:hypothetical protein D3C85_1806810 [compost metagenome]
MAVIAFYERGRGINPAAVAYIQGEPGSVAGARRVRPKLNHAVGPSWAQAT